MAIGILVLLGTFYYLYKTLQSKTPTISRSSIDLESLNQLSILQLRFEAAEALKNRRELTPEREKRILTTIFLPAQRESDLSKIMVANRKIGEKITPLLQHASKKTEARDALEQLETSYQRLKQFFMVAG